MKLRTKISFLLVPLIVLPLLVLGWFTYIELRETSEQHLFGEMQLSLDYHKAHMETEVATAHGNIELLSKQTLIKKYILTEDEDQRYLLLQPPLLRLFSSYQEAFPKYQEIRIFLPDGYEDVRQTQPYVENLSDEEGGSTVFKALQSAGDDIYSTTFRNPDNQRISLFVGRPLILGDKVIDSVGTPPKLRGYIGLTIDLSEVESHVRENIISDSGYLFVTDAAGNVLFESSKRSVGKTISAALIKSALSIEDGSRPVLLSFLGESAFLSGTALHTDLYLFAVLPESELHTIRYELGFVVALITLFTILITTLCVVVAMEHQVIRPIHRLGDLAKEIGRGNRSVEVNGMNAGDEIGELAAAFAEMAGNLYRSDEQVRFLAYHDSLTGLPNRTMFREYLDRAILEAQRNKHLIAVLFLDIDNFKQVNDSLGHQSGDTLLQKVAERFTKALRGYDYIARGYPLTAPDNVLARLGGDEFIILLSKIPDSHTPGVVAQRLIEGFDKPVPVSGQECHVSASIGITLYPVDGVNSDDLIKNADLAMYHAKEKGKNTYQYFRNSMNLAAIERMKLESRLRNALEQGHLELYYQPQVHSVSHEVRGLEALLRWRDPEDGLILPGDFIPVAETSGLILPIGEWVLHEACRQASVWQKDGYPVHLVSVNVSSIQFARQDVVSIVQSALAESRLDPRCLEIEITESAIMSDPISAVKMLDDIKALGVSVALDDFGTGYSSLSYLRQFSIDTLKIDRGFVREIDKKLADAEIVGAIAAMAHTLHLRVVVEGIERESQLAIVVERQCDVIQGFLFSRPLPADEVVNRLAERNLRIA